MMNILYFPIEKIINLSNFIFSLTDDEFSCLSRNFDAIVIHFEFMEWSDLSE